MKLPKWLFFVNVVSVVAYTLAAIIYRGENILSMEDIILFELNFASFLYGTITGKVG